MDQSCCPEKLTAIVWSVGSPPANAIREEEEKKIECLVAKLLLFNIAHDRFFLQSDFTADLRMKLAYWSVCYV